MSFLITYTSGLNWYICLSFCMIIYSFFCQFSLHYYWYCYNQKQSPVVFEWNFLNSQKNTSTRVSFLMKLQNLTLSKKEIQAQMFSCEFCDISHNTLFKELFRRLLLRKHSFSLLSHHDLSPFQKRFTKFLAEYFLDLIRRLGARVSSVL